MDKNHESKIPVKNGKFCLKVKPLSLLEAGRINQFKIEGRLFLFNIEKSPLVSKIIPKDTLIISTQCKKEKSENLLGEQVNVGNNIYQEGDNYFSEVEGYLIYENKLYDILEVKKDAEFSISVSKDRMKVFCDFYPPMEGNKNITVDDVLKLFLKNKITASPNIEMIRKIIKELQFFRLPILNAEIAMGKYPTKGQDGWIEYLVEFERKRDDVSDNEKVDFYDLGTIITVEENQKLAIIHPPTNGVAGIDVYGKIIPPPTPKKEENPKGTNTYFDEENPNLLRSKINGYLQKSFGKLNVSEKYNVRGNVDFHTGNILSKATLNVNGDVRSGFKLNIDKNITINGFISDAEIISSGSISVSGGFAGTGAGIIIAGGDVSVRHVRNQTIKADGDIFIMKEAVGSQLHAKGFVKSMSGQAIIIGGTTIAEKGVEVRTLGNISGVKTKVQVGMDIELYQKSSKLSVTIKELKRKLNEIKQRLDNYSRVPNLTESAKRKVKLMLEKYKKIKDELEQKENEKKRIDNILNKPTKSYIKVRGVVYPGVEIIIRHATLKIHKQIRNKTFSLSKDKRSVEIS
jgi:uncharacterized protein (DUF342 family)